MVAEEFNRRFLLYQLDLVIAEIDHRLPWPSSRRKFFNAVLRIHNRQDLGTYRGTARELLLEELDRAEGAHNVVRSEADQSCDRQAQARSESAWEAQRSTSPRSAPGHCSKERFSVVGSAYECLFRSRCGGIRIMRVAALIALLFLGVGCDCDPDPQPYPISVCESCNQSDPDTCGGHPSRCALTGSVHCCVR